MGGCEEADFETLLSSWSSLDDERKVIAQDFPLRLADALRDIIARGQS